MFIKNSEKLGSTKLRKDALSIAEEALSAIDTQRVLKDSVFLHGNFLFIQGNSFDLTNYRKVFLVTIGKDAFACAKFIKDLLGNYVSEGVVLGQKEEKIVGLKVFNCTHPNPSEGNVQATKYLVSFLKNTREDDLVIVAVSGGGSAMMSAPYKISVQEKAKVAKILMDSGATINELNIVRKHLSEIKGGHFARLVYPSNVVSVVFSDVVGDNLSTIASGPTVLDHSTVHDAQEILSKYKILEKIKQTKLELNETPKEEKYFHKIKHFLLLTNLVALKAMEKKARLLGYETEIFSRNLQGLASEVGKTLLKNSKPGKALIAAGETTVKITGNGEGGRNQELVLGNLVNLKENQILLSLGSDGHDNSNFAGALADTATQEKAKKLKLSPITFLKNNDSYNFFKEVEDGIETGKLESNIADLMLVLEGS